MDDEIHNLKSTNTLPNVLLTGHFNLPHINWDTQKCENKFIIKPNPHYGIKVNQALVDLALRTSAHLRTYQGSKHPGSCFYNELSPYSENYNKRGYERPRLYHYRPQRKSNLTKDETKENLFV